jgi:UTP pyrophosphatase
MALPLPLSYLGAYPPALQAQARELLTQGRLATFLLRRYPQPHAVRSDKALYDYTLEIKNRYLRGADAVNKVLFDNKIHVVRNALGLHTSVSRVQGGRLAAKHEIRIASLFKQAPAEFLRMIVVHELAHLREKNHDKAFYKLCEYMEPQYHQYEFDVRLYLTHVEHSGERLWGAGSAVASDAIP